MRRLSILAEAAMPDRERGLPSSAAGTTSVHLPGGGQTALMRIMQTNACSLTCGYCPLHRGARVRRVTLAPDEIVTTFMEAHRKGLADGLFLTSGVPGSGVRGVDRMLAAAELLRVRERFRGYIHLKLLPGVEDAQVERAVMLANRVSINLEGPGDAYVRALAHEKEFTRDLLAKLELAGRLYRHPDRQRAAVVPPIGTTTQFVVGAAGERDREILAVVGRLEDRGLLHHAHFSAFQPVAGTPMEHVRPVPFTRELRLYQAEHLLRQYRFRMDELVFDARGDLPLERDPKTAWALQHPEAFPVDLSAAPWERVVRVPGIGPQTARRLVTSRRGAVVRGLPDLRRLGVDIGRAAYFVAWRGRRLADTPPPEQLRLFSVGDDFRNAALRTAVPPCAFR